MLDHIPQEIEGLSWIYRAKRSWDSGGAVAQRCGA
jgi:hypothetical protein